MAKTFLSPAGISKKYNLSYQTVNYYTNLGLLTVRSRDGNNRLYNAKEVSSCLNKVTKLKSQGYSLRLIRGLIRKEL